MTETTRFAPSPNGRLHLGHAFSALLAHKLAAGGQFLLRIEDIDMGRARADFIDAIFADLTWLGLTWAKPVLRQSQRFPIYTQKLDRLRALDLVYPCWATRQEIRRHIESAPGGRKAWPLDPDGAPVYPNFYKHISQAERNKKLWEGGDFAWRLDMEKAFDLAQKKHQKTHNKPITFYEASTDETIKVNPLAYGDIILARKDIPTSYHLSMVTDDAAQNVTLVTRGLDLQPATHIHRILQILLDLSEPAYYHHALIRDAKGRRLSKQAGDESFADARKKGIKPADLIATLPPPIGCRPLTQGTKKATGATAIKAKRTGIKRKGESK